ncbi:MAG: hypothetical protein JXA44_06340 [Methanospirillaceae archaeon]|nr:hypothetical protein [Methanospirillaceae archaeon]
MENNNDHNPQSPDAGSDAINPFAVLGIGEALIRYCNGIRIKEHPFYIILSNKRIVLIDTYAEKGGVAKEIALHTISDVKPDPDHEGSGAALLIALFMGEHTRQMRFFFPSLIGGETECYEWLVALREVLHLPELLVGEILLETKSEDEMTLADDAVYLSEEPERKSYPGKKEEEVREQIPGQDKYDITESEEVFQEAETFRKPPHTLVAKPPLQEKKREKRRKHHDSESDIIDGETGEEVDREELKRSRAHRSNHASVPLKKGERKTEAPDEQHQADTRSSTISGSSKEKEHARDYDTLVIHVKKPQFRQNRLKRSYQYRSVIQEADLRPCLVCGVKIPIKARFCPSCGSEQG